MENVENVENVKNDPNIEPVEITSPITVERSKKPKKPKTTPLVKPEKKKEYDKRYRGKLAQTIATSAIEKYMETLKQEAPAPEKEKQEAPVPKPLELPEQLRPQINRDNIDLSNYVSKDKYKKLKENFKNINHEVQEIKNSIHPIPKYNPHVYKALFRR
jgi:hypothetical protein